MKRIFLIVLIFFLSHCQKQAETPIKNIESTSSDKTLIKFGVVARYSPRLIYQGYQPIMDYLTKKTDYTFILKLSRNYDQAINFLKEDSVQIASLGSYSYVEANRLFGAQCILKPLNASGKPVFNSIIIVREDSEIQQLKDLADKKVAFASVKATAGFLIPKKAIYNTGMTLDDLNEYTNIVR